MIKAYDTQQVCLNGHQITAFADTQPENRKEYCDICGAKSIMKCPNCRENIRGERLNNDVFVVAELPVPKFCHACGTVYPWANGGKMNAQTDNEKEKGNRYQVTKKNLMDTFKDHPVIFFVIAFGMGAGLSWKVSEEIRVKPKLEVISQNK